ncbi:MAG TPA: transposase [Pyrinomonadaceae bacterium]|nr:transposase [Pyrinomonadaceae bacterium]
MLKSRHAFGLTLALPVHRFFLRPGRHRMSAHDGRVENQVLHIRFINQVLMKCPFSGSSKRNGRVYTRSVEDVSRKTLRQIIKTKVVPESVIYTDSFRSYDGLVLDGFKHYRINHQECFALSKRNPLRCLTGEELVQAIPASAFISRRTGLKIQARAAHKSA